jgi:hypothetical protein
MTICIVFTVYTTSYESSENVRKTRPLNQALDEYGHSSVRRLLDHSKRDARLLEVVHLSGTTLVMYAASPAYATSLRFLSKQLRSALRARKLNVQSVRVKVLQLVKRPKMPPLPSPVLTPKGAETIRNTAVHIADDNLRDALMRLAANAKFGAE